MRLAACDHTCRSHGRYASKLERDVEPSNRKFLLPSHAALQVDASGRERIPGQSLSAVGCVPIGTFAYP